MRSLRHVVCLLLVLSIVLPAGAPANVEVEECTGAPLFAESVQGVLGLVKVALAKDFAVLMKSKRSYYVAFDTTDEICQALDVPPAAVEKLGGYFEKDVKNSKRYTIHVNSDWVKRDVEKGIANAGAKFASLPPEEQEKRQVLAYRISALCIIAHEGRHAVQAERNEIGFLPKLIAPGVHDKLAHDRYDEFAGYIAQHELAPRVVNKLDEARKATCQQEALAEVNKHYSHLKTQFLVVAKGKEVEGKAPYAWPETLAATESKSTAAFKTALADMAIAAAGAISQGNQSEAEALGGQVDQPADEGGASESAEESGDGADDAAALQCLEGECDIEVGTAECEPLETVLEGVLAGGPEVNPDQAMAKAATPVKRARKDYGEDPNALR
jgi:hypothetical protein